jgi:hypothetical protein
MNMCDVAHSQTSLIGKYIHFDKIIGFMHHMYTTYDRFYISSGYHIFLSSDLERVECVLFNNGGNMTSIHIFKGMCVIEQ